MTGCCAWRVSWPTLPARRRSSATRWLRRWRCGGGAMTEPHSCPDCLRRSRLLSRLAPYIERIATGEPGSRSPELLRLSNEDLAAVAAPNVAARLLEQVAAVPERRLRADLIAAECLACCCHGPRFLVELWCAADCASVQNGRCDPDRAAGAES